MLGLNLLPGFTNPLNIDNGLYKSLLELATAKIKMPNFSIRSAKNIGILEFSETYYRNLINLVGKLFINQQFPLSRPPYTLDLTYLTFSHTLGA